MSRSRDRSHTHTHTHTHTWPLSIPHDVLSSFTLAVDSHEETRPAHLELPSGRLSPHAYPRGTEATFEKQTLTTALGVAP